MFSCRQVHGSLTSFLPFTKLWQTTPSTNPNQPTNQRTDIRNYRKFPLLIKGSDFSTRHCFLETLNHSKEEGYYWKCNFPMTPHFRLMVCEVVRTPDSGSNKCILGPSRHTCIIGPYRHFFLTCFTWKLALVLLRFCSTLVYFIHHHLRMFIWFTPNSRRLIFGRWPNFCRRISTLELFTNY